MLLMLMMLAGPQTKIKAFMDVPDSQVDKKNLRTSSLSGGDIGNARRVTGDLHCRLTDFLHKIVVCRHSRVAELATGRKAVILTPHRKA